MKIENLPYGAVAGGCPDCDSYVYLDNAQYPFVAVNTIHDKTCPALTQKQKRSRMITSTERFEGENNG